MITVRWYSLQSLLNTKHILIKQNDLVGVGVEKVFSLAIQNGHRNFCLAAIMPNSLVL